MGLSRANTAQITHRSGQILSKVISATVLLGHVETAGLCANSAYADHHRLETERGGGRNGEVHLRDTGQADGSSGEGNRGREAAYGDGDGQTRARQASGRGATGRTRAGDQERGGVAVAGDEGDRGLALAGGA